MLSIKNLCKAYAVPVLNGVDIELIAGEVHALMGANGAGKTTLCKIICGLTAPEAGSMELNDVPYKPASITEAEGFKVRMVMQELSLVSNLTVAENIYLRALPSRRGFVNFRKINEEADETLRRFGLHDIDPRQKIHSLGIGQQQLVEIARVLIHPSDILILDEPTAALAETQVDVLFKEIKKLKETGTAIIYVSHRMDEIAHISDRITVLREGKSVVTSDMKSIQSDEIIRSMTGSVTVTNAEFPKRDAGPIALQLDNVSTTELLRDVSFNIYQGEILGIAGLMGSGRTEVLRSIFGVDLLSHGCLKIGSALKTITNNSPQMAVSYGMGLITEDRKQQGLLLEHSVKFNISLAALDLCSAKTGWLNLKKENREIDTMIKSLFLNCNSSEQIVKELSGGNQQKAIIARWMLRNCNVLLFDEPTRGIDIQTKQMIYKLMDELAREGKAIVMVSSETSELLGLCDRIAVMSNGKMAEMFDRDDWTAEKIMTAAFSHYTNAKVA